jgi:hypothetical protein
MAHFNRILRCLGIAIAAALASQPAWSQTPRATEAASDRPGCEMPKPSDNAKILLFSTEQGEGLSTITIGSQDLVVSTGIVTIEPGPEPLYVVGVTRSAVIWRLKGAVDRVERIVLASNANERLRGDTADTAPVGVTGIAAGRVSFLKSAECIRAFYDAPSIASTIAGSFVQRELGRAPVIVTGRVRVAEIALPSGAIKSEWKGEVPFLIDSSPLAVDAALAYPAGVVEIDPASVISSRPAEFYAILPGLFGLLQLVKSGVLQPNKSGELLIKKKMRFPGGLYGADSAKFLLLRGVPEPEGNPGHSCVYSEETGKFNGGARC